MPKARFAIKPGLVKVIFHTPIEPKEFGSRDHLMEKVRATIDSGLPEECRQGAWVGENTQLQGGTKSA
jgi:hypothetical protein